MDPRNSQIAVYLLTISWTLDDLCVKTLGRIHPDLGESFLMVFNKTLDLLGVEL